MARQRRRWHPDRFHHVIMRGNNRRNIYQHPTDFKAFFRALSYAYSKHPFTLVAYCVMSNHYHLLIRSPEVPLGKVMSYVNRYFGDYYRRKYEYTGFLYESRYYSDMITSSKGLLTVSRYIHRNPIETTIPIVSRMEQYAYSSFYYYKTAAPSPYPFLDLELLPASMPMKGQQTKPDYCLYCEEEKTTLPVENE